MKELKDLNDFFNVIDDVLKPGITLVDCHESINQVLLSMEVSEFACFKYGLSVQTYLSGDIHFSKKQTSDEGFKKDGDVSIKLKVLKDCVVDPDEPNVYTVDDIFKSFAEFKTSIINSIKDDDVYLVLVTRTHKLISNPNEKDINQVLSKMNKLSVEMEIPIIAFIQIDEIDLNELDTFEDDIIMLPDTFSGVTDRQLILVEPENDSEKINA